AVYPAARSYVAQRQAPEVEVARATQVVASAGGSTDLPVLVASGYVVARHSSDVGVKSGGRIARLTFEEGTRVRKGAGIAELEHTNVRAPFDGVVIKKRAEVGETVSPFGVAGQATREGGAIATIADLGELEVQTEVSENSVAKLASAMPAEVKLQAYQDQVYRGKLRQIFPSADRAKSIVEVRVSILNPDAHVKPEMTASVTFQDNRAAGVRRGSDPGLTPAAPIVVIPKRAV